MQVENKQLDEYDENYLDTALEDLLVWSDSHDTACPRNGRTSDNNCGFEGNGSNSWSNIYSSCSLSEPLGHITISQSTKSSKEFTDNVSSDPKVCNTESDLSKDFHSLDFQYCSDCDIAIQTGKSEGFSLFSNKYNHIVNTRESCMDTSNTESVNSHISGKLVESRNCESKQFNSDISFYSAVSHSTHSEIACEPGYPIQFGSELFDREGESIMSIQSVSKSCRSNSIGDSFYSAQSELPEALLQSQISSSHIIQPEIMPYPCYCPKEFDAVPSDGWSESQFSLQTESSHHAMLENDPYSAKLISFPTACTEESELTLSGYRRKLFLSTLSKSFPSDSFRKYHSLLHSEQHGYYSLREFGHSTQPDASLHERSGKAVPVYGMSKILFQSDNEMETNSFSHSFSISGQSEMKSAISDQVSNNSHGFSFFEKSKANMLCKSKVTFDESTYEIVHEIGKLNMANTEISAHEKHFLKIPKVLFERIPKYINMKNRIYYWHQVMQLYFILMTALSFGESLKWLFQLRPVTMHALQRLQSTLNYPFTNLNEFFNCESRESPASAEERMSVEWMRLQTFQNYPVTAHGSPIRLARDGFFYTGQGTQTRCFSCGVSHEEWKFLDNPHEVHQRLSPNCPFLNGRQEEHINIPMSPDGNGNVGRADRDSIPPPSLPFGSDTGQSRIVRGRSESREITRASKTTDEDDTIRHQQKSGSGETALRVQPHPVEESAQYEVGNRPKFPEHVSLPSRIATFGHGWPPYLDQTPQQMAAAGFFFTGNQDYTRCYQCGGGLRNWEPADNPWIEHCRWYPTCPHVQKGKGQRFVNAVLKKQAELLSTQRAESRREAQYGIGRTDPLETLAAISLLEMGYPRDVVHNSILTLCRQREPGAEVTALKVLEFIWKEEDIERQQQEEEANRPHYPGDAQTPALSTLMERLNLGGSPAVTQGAVQQSKSITTSASSINSSAAMMITSVAMATSSTTGTSSITSVSTSASRSTQITIGSGQRQKQHEVQGHNTSAAGNGNKSHRSRPRDGVPEGSVSKGIAAQNDEGSEKGEPRPSGAEGGQSEGPGAHAVAAVIDEKFHSLDSEGVDNKDNEELEEENKMLKEQTTCKICMENPVRVIFLPCGHFVCCELCAPAFQKCPICRKHIQQFVKTFL
ncbi:hypothetical protein CHS0354_002517 [Potamilus streckersoni]|uniref:RING-type domain-containing protein n=1 Tax=Potamilus streckersoni TaxID=2493646 RepID=A0AAE0SSM9_9BIVA|nr:hypothetical protein CHS0354_002517 [Potamilus streckersoni]